MTVLQQTIEEPQMEKKKETQKHVMKQANLNYRSERGLFDLRSLRRKYQNLVIKQGLFETSTSTRSCKVCRKFFSFFFYGAGMIVSVFWEETAGAARCVMSGGASERSWAVKAPPRSQHLPVASASTSSLAG